MHLCQTQWSFPSSHLRAARSMLQMKLTGPPPFSSWASQAKQPGLRVHYSRARLEGFLASTKAKTLCTCLLISLSEVACCILIRMKQAEGNEQYIIGGQVPLEKSFILSLKQHFPCTALSLGGLREAWWVLRTSSRTTLEPHQPGGRGMSPPKWLSLARSTTTLRRCSRYVPPLPVSITLLLLQFFTSCMWTSQM